MASRVNRVGCRVNVGLASVFPKQTSRPRVRLVCTPAQLISVLARRDTLRRLIRGLASAIVAHRGLPLTMPSSLPTCACLGTPRVMLMHEPSCALTSGDRVETASARPLVNSAISSCRRGPETQEFPAILSFIPPLPLSFLPQTR